MSCEPKFPECDVHPLDEVGRRLLRAAEIIRTRGWCQGTLFDINGAVCTLGAIQIARRDANGGFYYEMPEYARVTEYVRENGGHVSGNEGLHYVARWNDMPGRTADDVINALTQAAFHREIGD